MQRHLKTACRHNHPAIVEMLLEAGANPDGDAHSPCPLLYAAEQGHDNICHLLLQAGANVNHQPQGYPTPLYEAAHNGHLHTAHLLMAAGGNAKNTVVSFPFKRARPPAEPLPFLQLLFDHGAVPHEGAILTLVENFPKDCVAISRLFLRHISTEQSQTRFSVLNQALIAAMGRTIYYRDRHPESPDDGDECREIIKMLLNAFENMHSHTSDPNMNTAWTWALEKCRGGDSRWLKVLIDCGFDMKHPAVEGALMEGTDEKMIMALVSAGLDIHVGGDIVLEIAVRRGQVDLVRKLVQAGADPNARDGAILRAVKETAAIPVSSRVDMLEALRASAASSLSPASPPLHGNFTTSTLADSSSVPQTAAPESHESASNPIHIDVSLPLQRHSIAIHKDSTAMSLDFNVSSSSQQISLGSTFGTEAQGSAPFVFAQASLTSRPIKILRSRKARR
ncbi:hypothetical protein HDV00_008812 [Rhizophlyctis rosea]|nr:hypothetical protein HDV00_008812 [Rhizophlyctis rosea]